MWLHADSPGRGARTTNQGAAAIAEATAGAESLCTNPAQQFTRKISGWYPRQRADAVHMLGEGGARRDRLHFSPDKQARSASLTLSPEVL